MSVFILMYNLKIKEIMSIKHMISILVALCMIFSGACKKGVPTGPDVGLISEFSGEITLNGQAFSNVDVYLSWSASKKTTSGADGIFSFTDLVRGGYFVTPSQVGYAFSPSNYEVGDQARTDLNFTAHIATYGSVVGNIVADFTAVDQNGQNISLNDYFSKVILINFSADWCGPCREEAGHLESIYNQYKNTGFQIITILTSGSPSSWAEEYDLTFPVLDDIVKSIWNIYGEGYVPLNIILDRNCVIRYKEAGFYEGTIKEIIEKYL